MNPIGGSKMKKKILISVVLVLLSGVCISTLLLRDRLFETSIQDITSEQNYTIQAQEKTAVTLSIPKSKLSDAIYTSEGQSFSENEIVVYKTDTTTIYLEKVMLSNESNEQLYFVFNCSYDLPDDGAVLVPYKKNDDKSYSYEADLGSKDLTDDTTTYPEAVRLRGQGPSEQFVYYISADVCRKAVGTIRINSFMNRMTYIHTK